MQQEQPNIWDDDGVIYISEMLFEHLPKEYREAAESRKRQGKNVLRIADKDIQVLIALINAFPTTSSLSYIFHRLRASKFDSTTAAFMEQEVLTTSFVVTYGRLFAKGEGASGVSRGNIPEHLRPVHDELIQLRNKRYAHNGSHESVSSGILVDFDDYGFRVQMQMSLGFYVGGRNEWKELITFIDAHMHERLTKILRRLKDKTGYDWTVPEGPVPDWVGSYG